MNSDLYYNLRVQEHSTFECGHQTENAEHFLLRCPLYNDIRASMLSMIPEQILPTIDNLLYGDIQFEMNLNYQVFSAVHQFIIDSKRFV